MNNVKQVMVWRKDLKVRKGKFAAQIAHASIKIFFDKMKVNKGKVTSCDMCSYHYNCNNPDHYDYVNCTYYKPWISIHCSFTPEMMEWMEGSFTKIVVGCNSLEELLTLQKQAKEADLPNAIIEDSGATEFKEDCPKCDNEEWTGSYCDRCNNTGKINKPTITCLAIGPANAEDIDKITGGLELL